MAVSRISPDQLKERLDGASGEPPVIVDARLKYPYEHSTMTLPGALRAPAALSSLPRDREVVVYDSDPDEIAAERVAADLIARGYRAVVLAGGIGAWAAAKLPTDTKSAPQPAVAPGSTKG